MWIDVTWGAGGSTADKTLEICINALKYHGLNVMMHLTCTNMPKEKLKEALDTCKANGIRNILALRGDPPGHLEKGAEARGSNSAREVLLMPLTWLSISVQSLEIIFALLSPAIQRAIWRQHPLTTT